MSTLNTTAIKNYNVAVTRQSGRVGNVRYVQRNGETYVRSAANSVIKNARTDKQMTQRMRYASLSALFSMFGTNIHGAFQNKLKNQSDFNAFMQFNKSAGCYMTKDEKMSGTVIAMPVMIAQGTLTPVTGTYESGALKTNIAVGTSADISTVAKLSAAIIASNSGKYKEGDQLTLVCFDGSEDNSEMTGVSYKRVILNLKDTSAPEITFQKASGYLSVLGNYKMALGLIHSDADGKASNTTMVMTEPGQAILDEYLTDEKFTEARNSYGTAEARYLNGGSATTTTSSEEDSDGPFTISLTASPANAGTVTGAGSYAKNATATIKAEAISGYHFTQWSDGDTNATRTLTVTADKSLTAIFAQNSEDGE